MKLRLWLSIATIVGLALFGQPVRADEQKVALEKLPKEVLKAVKDKYPKAELVEALQEDEDGATLYEVLVKIGDKKIELTLTAAGEIKTIEKEFSIKDLPKVVAQALDRKYPKAELKSAAAVFEIEEGKEELEYYEVTLETADKKMLAIKIDDEGKIEEEEPITADNEQVWTSDFSFEKEDLASTGRNRYLILEPGYQLVFENGKELTTITVLDETKVVDGIETRVVEERESKDGKLIEVSRNYLAISKRTNSVYYFGEDVDMYQNDKVTGHEGSWLSGVNNAKFGLLMPGIPLIGAMYQQEVAAGVAMDRAEIESVTETVKVPAGEFKNCLAIHETTPLEPGKEDTKLYAPNVGLIADGSSKLVKYGKVELKK